MKVKELTVEFKLATQKFFMIHSYKLSLPNGGKSLLLIWSR